MKRRALLKAAGVASVIVAAGGVWRASEQGVCSIGSGPAYAPWLDWQQDTASGPMALVRAAILAANPHNTQPWLFRVSAARIELFAATARNLGSFDPYLREMHIGLGCAVENMCLAATANQLAVELNLPAGSLLKPQQNDAMVLVAALQLTPASTTADALYEQIPHRHTNRGPYERLQALPDADLQMLRQMAAQDTDLCLFLFSDAVPRAAFGEAVVQSTQTIIDDAAMVRDSEKWFRHSWADVQRLRDGPTLDAAGLPPVLTAIAKMLPPPSADTNHRYWLDATRDVHVASAPAFGLIAVRELYDRPQALRAGRLWQRLHLWATSRGIAMQPLNQPVELVDRQRQLDVPPTAADLLAKLSGEPDWQPTFAFRLGYPQRPASASPRRDLTMVTL